MDGDNDDKKDPGELEHEDVPKQRHDRPSFEREARRKHEEPPVRRGDEDSNRGAGDGDSDKGSGESRDGSSSSEGSE